jgi:SWI/SNF-related matrix-associated actin-dependent regulator 1 of chromatin subfamily A
MLASRTYKGFELSFTYNPRIIADVKAIPGHRWNPVDKVWTIPFTEEHSVNWLLKKYGGQASAPVPEEVGEIPPLPELSEEHRQIIEQKLSRTLFKFQNNGVAYTLEKKQVIIGDEPGLGKTTQAIAAIVAANAFPCLIICPSTLKSNWEREWMQVAGIRAMVLRDAVRNTWVQYHNVGITKVFITNYESLKKYFVDSIKKKEDEGLKLKHITFKKEIDLFKAIVVDELHKCKDGSTQQSKFVMGIAKDKPMVLGLTGTPIVNKPKDLIAQLHVVGRLGELGGYTQFMKRYCGGNGSGATNLRELHYKLASTCFYQRHKKEVLQDLPDKMRQIVLCDISTRREYDAALADLAVYLKEYKSKTDPEVQKSMRGEMMVKIGVCKNISARGKLAEVVENINEVVEAGEKIVVFLHQKEIYRALKNEYPDAVSVVGDDPMDQRQINVDRFQNDPSVKIILCGIKPAGVGITLTASSRVLFVELPWHPADCDQCEDRCHRIGQKGSVQATYMLGKNTIDEYIYEIIESKRSVANTVTGAEDSVQREIIDKLAASLFNTKSYEDD